MAIFGPVGQGHHHVCAGRHHLGESTVPVPSGEGCLFAQVLPARLAVGAVATRPGEPREAGPVALGPIGDPFAEPLDATGNLMPKDDGHGAGAQVALGDLHVGAARGACPHSYEHLTRTG